MKTSANVTNILISIERLSPEDKILLVEQLQQKKEAISADNPWIKLAGKYENDPMYDEVLSSIEEYRHQIDTETEDNY